MNGCTSNLLDPGLQIICVTSRVRGSSPTTPVDGCQFSLLVDSTDVLGALSIGPASSLHVNSSAFFGFLLGYRCDGYAVRVDTRYLAPQR